MTAAAQKLVIPQSNVDFWWSVAWPRDKKPYGYGGNWNRDNVNWSTDCSGLVCFVLAALTRGPAGWQWNRWPISTENWRVLDYGQVGPFGTICVPNRQAIPADAAVKIGLHHGGGGPDSHMWCTLMDRPGGINIESSGTYGQRMGGPARGIDWNYANDFAYLPGPIETVDWEPVLDYLQGNERELTNGNS